MTRKQRRNNAVTFAREQITHPTPAKYGFGADWYDDCLGFVRTALGAEGGYYDAKASYAHTAVADRHASKNPPAGVPVWFKTPTHWHVALSTGDGNCDSTDIKRKGKIDEVAIMFIESRWGIPCVGWTETINGQRVYGDDK